MFEKWCNFLSKYSHIFLTVLIYGVQVKVEHVAELPAVVAKQRWV